MKNLNKLRLFALLIFCVYLTSCMQYTEEIWLEKDMSGKVRFDFKIYQQWQNFIIPDLDQVRLDASLIEGIRVSQLESQDTDSNLSIQVEIQFESISHLQDLFSKPYLHPYLGDVSLTKNKKGHFVVRRFMQGKESPFFKEKEIVANLTLAEKKTMDLGLPWIWKIHAPSQVLFRTKGFRTPPDEPMTYGVNFKKVASSGVELRIVFEDEDASIPMNVWIATLAFGIVMLAILVGIFVGSRKKRARIIPR